MQCQLLTVTSSNTGISLLNVLVRQSKGHTPRIRAILRSWCFLDKPKGGTNMAAQYKIVAAATSEVNYPSRVDRLSPLQNIDI